MNKKSFYVRTAKITTSQLKCELNLKEGLIMKVLRSKGFLFDSNGMPRGDFSERTTKDGGLFFKQMCVFER